MNKTISLLDMKKKGAVETDKAVNTVIGLIVVILIMANVAPEMFSSLGIREVNETSGECISNCSTPEWIQDVLIVLAGVGLVYMIWRFIKTKTD